MSAQEMLGFFGLGLAVGIFLGATYGLFVRRRCIDCKVVSR